MDKGPIGKVVCDCSVRKELIIINNSNLRELLINTRCALQIQFNDDDGPYTHPVYINCTVTYQKRYIVNSHL